MTGSGKLNDTVFSLNNPTMEAIDCLVKLAQRVFDAEEDVDLEKMAEIEHTRWSGWQEYLHSKCIKNEDGSLTIPSGYVENLVRLINTPYDKLTEKEKESDRAEAKNSLDQAALVIAKNYRRVSESTGEISDGYHTFNELYDHRCLLWINCVLLQHPKMCYLVENHLDEWFLLGVETPIGQISYHCPNKYLLLVKNITRRQPTYDGHTSQDVIKRLEKLASTR